MRNTVLIFAFLFMFSLSFTSCRETVEERREIEIRTDDVADDIEDAADEVGDEIEDAVDDVEDEID